ncbi:DOMON-like domain-containing protein [Novosphingobium sp.]|uniref:DOMON-like domain-containing protein n=1 Tax=Novosphingobium sp. TaxID=1874826 RepID=UPI0025F4F53D|nr:DOMON-like domain-containing protein [Novosphingobium sp.]
METFRLLCHAETPPIGVTGVRARIVSFDANWLMLRWRIESAAAIVAPPLAGKGRTAGLWQKTCFELFVRSNDTAGYCEFNLSPSERWAAYDFSGYRDGMQDRPVLPDPVCTFRAGSAYALFDAAIPASALPAKPWHYSLTAVIEEAGSAKSYWAIAHPLGKPDFHHPACFAATLAAPGEQ